MRIGDGGLADVIVDGMPSLFVGSDQLDFDLGPVRRLPLHHLVDDDLRRVLARVDLDFVIMSRLFGPGARCDRDRFPGGQQSVHAGCRNPDALLSPGLLQRVKLRSIEQLPEDLGDLRFDNSGAVVFNGDSKAIFGQLLDLDFQHGQNSRFLAGVQRIVDRFLDGRQKRLLRIVESEKMAVFAEKFGNRNFPLARGHALRGLADFCFFGELDPVPPWVAMACMRTLPTF